MLRHAIVRRSVQTSRLGCVLYIVCGSVVGVLWHGPQLELLYDPSPSLLTLRAAR